MKKIILLVCLVALGLFLTGCGENLAGQAFGTGDNIADGYLTIKDEDSHLLLEETDGNIKGGMQVNNGKLFIQNWNTGNSRFIALDLNSGNVGIGTASPALDIGGSDRILEIEGSANPTLVLDEVDAGQWAVLVQEGDFMVFESQAGSGNGVPFIIESGADRNSLYIKSDNNVGIGTADPQAKLDVEGNIKASGTICDKNGCIGSGSGGEGSSPWTESWGKVYRESGSVGIGTNDPQARLDVYSEVSSGTPALQLRGDDSNFKTKMDSMKIQLDGQYSDAKLDAAGLTVNNENAGLIGIHSHVVHLKDAPSGGNYAYMTPHELKMTSLGGEGNAYVCVDSSGKLYRSTTACV